MNFFILEDQWIEQINLEKVLNSIAKEPVSYTHLTLPTTPYV